MAYICVGNYSMFFRTETITHPNTLYMALSWKNYIPLALH